MKTLATCEEGVVKSQFRGIVLMPPRHKNSCVFILRPCKWRDPIFRFPGVENPTPPRAENSGIYFVGGIWKWTGILLSSAILLT